MDYVCKTLYIVFLTCLPVIRVLDSRSNSCLTWEIQQNRLKLICRINDFFNPVSLVDSLGQLYATCTFNRNTHTCAPVEKTDLVVFNLLTTTVIFTIEELTENMNGKWTCMQNKMRLTTNVSLYKGVIHSTDVRITGHFYNDKDNQRIRVRCFSCREPDGYNAEFLQNQRSVDSISFSHDTGRCIHYKGVCHPDECTCTQNEFIHVFKYEISDNGSIYSCDMLFTDPFTNQKFSMLASVVFTGQEFNIMNTSTVIKKNSDRIWNGTFNAKEEIHIVTDVYIPRITTSSDNVPSENSEGNPIVQVIIIVIPCVVATFFALCIGRYYYKRKQSHTGNSTRSTKWKLISPEDSTFFELAKRTRTSEAATFATTGIEEPTADKQLIVTLATTEIEDSTADKPLIEKNSFHKKIQTEISTFVCGRCTKSKNRSAVFLCFNCEETFCAMCTNDHKRGMLTEKHKVVSTNKIPRSYCFPLMCTDHDNTYVYYCVDHECLCCTKCIQIWHAEYGCTFDVIVDVSKGFRQSHVFLEYTRLLDACILLHVELNSYQYRIIDKVAHIKTLKSKEELIHKEHALDNYATETFNIISTIREQQDLIEFMKTHGSESQLFLLTHFLKESFIKIDERMLKLVKNTKRISKFGENLQEDLAVISVSIETLERKLKDISLTHQLRQSQTPIQDSTLKKLFERS